MEVGKLLFGVCQVHDGAERSLSDTTAADDGGQVENHFLDLWRETKHADDLRHSRPSDPLSSGEFSLILDLAGVKLTAPLLGLPEELGHVRQLQLTAGGGRPPSFGGHVHDPVGGDAPLEAADAPVRERSLGPEGDLNGLFVQLGPR